MKNIDEKRFSIHWGGDKYYNLYINPLGKLNKIFGMQKYCGTISIDEKLNSKEELIDYVFSVKDAERKHRLNPYKYEQPSNFIYTTPNTKQRQSIAFVFLLTFSYLLYIFWR